MHFSDKMIKYAKHFFGTAYCPAHTLTNILYIPLYQLMNDRTYSV